MLDGTLRVPANPFVPRRLLYYGTRKAGDSDYRMVLSGRVANQDHHGPAWNTLVGVHPGVPEVTPDVLQPKSGVFAICVPLDELNIRLDCAAKLFESRFQVGRTLCCRQISSKTFAIPHDRINGVPTFLGQAFRFHPFDKGSRRRLTQLIIAVD